MRFTQAVKEYALNIGFCRAGVTPVSGFEQYRDIVLARKEDYCFLTERAAKSAQIAQLAPEAKSILVLAYDYMQVQFPENLREHVGRIYLSRGV